MTAVYPPSVSSNLPKTNRKIRTDRPRTLSHPNRINLNSQQTEVVSRLLSQDIEITSKDEAFRLEVNVLQFLQKLYGNLRKRGIYVLSDGIRLVGSVASSLVSSELESELNAINDLDLSIYIDPASEMPESLYFSILQAQEEALHYFVKNQLENRLTWKEIFEAFFVEVNKVEDVEGGESWSLLSVGSTYTIDIKYILQTKRKYAFSADSLEIILNPFLKVVNQAAAGPSTKQNLITQVESTYGDTRDAIQHVQSKLIKTKEPTQIRRGIFRFCLELAKGRKCELESEYQEYITVFGNAFFEEFAALPGQGEEEFKVYLEKFISKHPTHAAGILSSLRSVLCHLTTQPNRDKYLEILTAVEKNSDL